MPFSNTFKPNVITMKTIKFIFILIVFAAMLYTLGGCTSQHLCPTYSNAVHQGRQASAKVDNTSVN